MTYPHADHALDPERVAMLAEGFCPWGLRQILPRPHPKGTEYRPHRLVVATVETAAGDRVTWGYCPLRQTYVKLSDGLVYTVDDETAWGLGWTRIDA
jgi:hypothetical protein